MSLPTSPRRAGTRGFTLIELMVAVAVVAILATIAIPSYSEYVKRGTRADAQSFLMEVALRQQQRLVDRRAYAASITDLGLSVPSAIAAKYSVSMSVPAVVPPNFTITAAPQGTQSTEPCGTLAVSSNGSRSPAKCWQ